MSNNLLSISKEDLERLDDVISSGDPRKFEDYMEYIDIRKNINHLSDRVNGCPFYEAPTEWQRMVEQMVKRGITFNVGETKKMNNAKFSILMANKTKKESSTLINSLIEESKKEKGLSERFLLLEEKLNTDLKGERK